MSDSVDRSAILARRMFLVSSALAGLHCSTGIPAANSAPSSRPLPIDWKTHLAKAPPRLDAAGFPEVASRELSGSLARIDACYAALEKLFEPGGEESCAPDTGACRALWAARSERVKQAQDAIELIGSAPCDDDGHPASFEWHVMEHRQFLSESFELASAYWEDLAKSFGWSASEVWRHQSSHPSAMRPCLTCALAKRISLTASFTFSEGSTSLGPDADHVVGTIKERLTETGMGLELWGHASRSEKNPAEIARLRAEGARDALTKSGVDAARVTIVPFGAGLVDRGLVEVVITRP